MKKTFVDVLLELPVDNTLQNFLAANGLPLPDDLSWSDGQEVTRTVIEAIRTWPDEIARDALIAKLMASVALGDAAGKQAMFQVARQDAAVNQQYALCPYCNLHRGQVVADGKGGRLCQCPECGPIQLEPQDMAAVTLNEDWLRQRLRMAMEINSRDGIDQVSPGVWRLGDARQGPVILARNLSGLVHAPATLDALRVNASRLRVITPKPIDQTAHPFAADIDWLPLQERFAFYGGGISFIAPQGQRPTETQREPAKPVYGPFAKDFRSVLLPELGHINLTEAQASVFGSLWSFKGEPMRAERIMERAGLQSDKPIDVFKVKSRDKGKAGADLPLMAYKKLVVTQQRQGLYALPCAAE